MPSPGREALPEREVRSVAIIGGGVAGWSVAAALSHRLPCAIRVVDSGSDPTVGPLALSTLPTIQEFHDLIGLDEDALMRASRATFKLGAKFVGWSPDGQPYFEPFGSIGAGFGGAAFHHVAAMLHEAGKPASLQDYSLAAQAAQLDRFARPSEDPRSVLSTLAYALHLDGELYAAALRASAEARGVHRTQAAVDRVEATGGALDAVVLDDGERIEADLFVDCSGPDAILMQALGVGWEDWSRWSPFDGLAQVNAQVARAPSPYSTIDAHAAGWRSTTPLQGAAGLANTYSRETLSDDEAVAALLSTGRGRAKGEPSLSRVRCGRRERAWVGNCLAIGASAGVPGALDVSVHLVDSGIQRLLALFPDRGAGGAEPAEFNRLAAAEMERLRDFAILRLRVNGRRGEALWDRCRETPGPDSLEYRIGLYRSRGRVALYDEEVFPEPSWVSVLTGQGVWPRRHDFRIDALGAAAVEEQLRRMRTTMRSAAEAMPAHADFLRRCGAAPPGVNA